MNTQSSILFTWEYLHGGTGQRKLRISLVVQRLRLRFTSKISGFKPWLGTRSHVFQLRPSAEINKYKNNLEKSSSILANFSAILKSTNPLMAHLKEDVQFHKAIQYKALTVNTIFCTNIAQWFLMFLFLLQNIFKIILISKSLNHITLKYDMSLWIKTDLTYNCTVYVATWLLPGDQRFTLVTVFS